jgi:hypothetical protein
MLRRFMLSLHTCINTQVPAHRRDQLERLLRYGGCSAPHSRLRGAITPTPRQQGVEGDDATPGSPCWGWARLLKRVFALDLATCPFCRQGALRILAAITQAEVIRKILRHLKLAADPPPIAPARSHQEAFNWVA